MLNLQDSFISLLSILVASIILIILFISYYNKSLIDKHAMSINDDYDKYKNELKNQNDILNKQILKQLSEINIDSSKSNNVNGKNLVDIFIKLRGAIKENCISAMSKIGAARIAIYLFHNGTHSTNGISFLKMSCICEKVSIGSGIRERMVELTNIPINLFDDMIDKLITYNRYIIMNNDETQETNHKIFISADKIYYTQLVTIYDINNNILGFVAVEMDRPYSKDEADKEKEILDDLVKQLVPVLSYSDYTMIKS